MIPNAVYSKQCKFLNKIKVICTYRHINEHHLKLIGVFLLIRRGDAIILVTFLKSERNYCLIIYFSMHKTIWHFTISHRKIMHKITVNIVPVSSSYTTGEKSATSTHLRTLNKRFVRISNFSNLL